MKTLPEKTWQQLLEQNKFILGVEEKLPTSLYKHQTIEFTVIEAMGMPGNIKFILSWDDDKSLQNKKEIELSL